MPTWLRLPAELRNPILDMVATLAPKGSRPRHACVNKEWQVAMERHTFREIEVTSCADSFSKFATIVTGKRRIYVQQIRFRAMLCHGIVERGEEYYSDFEYTKEERDKDFSDAIWKLFRLLHKWYTPKLMAARLSRGIGLEIIACHQTKEDREDEDRHRPTTYQLRVRSELRLRLCDDFIANAKSMIAEIVTSLSVTKSNERDLSAEAITTLLKCLPRVEHLYYEPRAKNRNQQHENRLAYLLKGWPRSLQSIEFYRDKPIHQPNPLYPTAHLYHNEDDPYDPINWVALGSALAHFTASHNLQHFSSIDGPDALHFLSADVIPYPPPDLVFIRDEQGGPNMRSTERPPESPKLFTPVWNKLQTLTLTSYHLSEQGDPNPLLLHDLQNA